MLCMDLNWTLRQTQLRCGLHLLATYVLKEACWQYWACAKIVFDKLNMVIWHQHTWLPSPLTLRGRENANIRHVVIKHSKAY